MRGRQKMGGWLGRVQRCTIQCTMDHAIGVVWCWSSKMRRGVWTRPMIQWDETVEGPGGTAIPIIKRKAENVRGSGVKWIMECWSSPHVVPPPPPYLHPSSTSHAPMRCLPCAPLPHLHLPSIHVPWLLTYQAICSSMYSNRTWTWWWCMWWNNHPTIQAQLWMMPPFFFWKNKRKKLPFIVEGPNESFWYPHIKIHHHITSISYTAILICDSIASLLLNHFPFLFFHLFSSSFKSVFPIFLFFFFIFDGVSKEHLNHINNPKHLIHAWKLIHGKHKGGFCCQLFLVMVVVLQRYLSDFNLCGIYKEDRTQ